MYQSKSKVGAGVASSSVVEAGGSDAGSLVGDAVATHSSRGIHDMEAQHDVASG